MRDVRHEKKNKYLPRCYFEISQILILSYDYSDYFLLSFVAAAADLHKNM